MATPWQAYMLASTFFFGVWGFLSKVALNHTIPRNMVLYQSIGIILITPLLLQMFAQKAPPTIKGISYSMLSGVASVVGVALFFFGSTNPWQSLRSGNYHSFIPNYYSIFGVGCTA